MWIALTPFSHISFFCSFRFLFLCPWTCRTWTGNSLHKPNGSSQGSYAMVHLLYLEMQQYQGMLVVENLPDSAGHMGDRGSIPGSGRSPRGGQGNPLQYSCLENPMDRGSWRATVHRVEKSWTQLKRLSTHTGKHFIPQQEGAHSQAHPSGPLCRVSLQVSPGSGPRKQRSPFMKPSKSSHWFTVRCQN